MVKTQQKLGPWQTAWLETLELGMFEQCKEFLCLWDVNEQQDIEYSFCCLGLACEVAMENGEDVTCDDTSVEDQVTVEPVAIAYYGNANAQHMGVFEILPKAVKNLFAFREVDGEINVKDEKIVTEIRDWLRKNGVPEKNLPGTLYMTLASFNDLGMPFETIAEFVRAFPYLVFSEPA